MSKHCTLKGKQEIFTFQRGLASSCCRAQPESLVKFVDFKELQDHWNREYQQLANGIKLPGCEICWNYEQQGIQSYRQENKDSNYTLVVGIFVDNLCNQMCSYCGPNYSSSWQQSVEIQGPFVDVSDNTKYHQLPLINSPAVNVDRWLEDIKNYIDTLPDDSAIINLLGGEPLMQIKNIEILQSLNIKKFKYIGITTNLNPPNPKFLHRLFDLVPFEKIQFAISIDATPEYNHVPRAGFDKTRFLNNLNFVLDKNPPSIVFMSVLSVLGALDLANYVKWARELGVQPQINTINNPECLHPMYLPRKIKDQILEQCQNLDLPKNVIDILMHEQETVDHILIEQYNYLIQYFTRTGIDPEQVDHDLFKQYWTWLKEFNENSPGI